MSTPYVPPGASRGDGSQQDAVHAPQPSASGYTPPGASPTGGAAPTGGASPTAGAAPGYKPPGAAAASKAQPSASGYTPPSVGGPRSPEPPVVRPAPKPPTPAAVEPEPTEAAVPEPEPGARPAVPRVVVIAGVVVAVLLGVLLIAWLAGAFAPKMTRLPSSVGAYSMDASTRKSGGNVLDSATYRAGAGVIVTASIVAKAPDPAAAYGKASEATRYSEGAVYCTGVSKSGKGGTCRTLLSTGSAVQVEASTRHQIAEIAELTQSVAAGVS